LKIFKRHCLILIIDFTGVGGFTAEKSAATEWDGSDQNW